MRTARDIHEETLALAQAPEAEVMALKPNGHAPDRARPAPEPEAEPFAPIDFPAREGRSPPPRRFVVDGWIPVGCVTSLYGPGGVGKSLLAQQVATCVALGVSAFGFTVGEYGPVVGIFTEDDDDELWRRQERVNGAMGAKMGQLRALHLQGRVGLDNILATYPSNQDPQLQPLVDAVKEACVRYRPTLLILDNIAQLFGGNENDRFQVSHFCNAVSGLAREFDCAVLLLGHPAKAEDSEYSGSTAWSAAVRSRLLLQRDKEGGLSLARVKSNYALPDTMPMAWVDGVLRPAGGGGTSEQDREAAGRREAEVEAIFLAALDQLTAMRVNVSHSERATNYAPKKMIGRGVAERVTRKDLTQAMDRLLRRGVVVANSEVFRGPDRKPRTGLARAADAGNPCGEEANDAEAEADAEASPDTSADAEGGAGADVEADAGTAAEVDAEGEADAEGESEGEADAEAANAEADAEDNADADPEGEAKCEGGDGGRGGDETDVEVDTDTDTGAKDDTEAGGGAGADGRGAECGEVVR